MSYKLKPCPFCGGNKLDFSLKVSSRNYNGSDIYHGVIYCKNCHTYGCRVLCYSDEKYTYTKEEKSNFEKEAIKAWNTRPKDKLQAFHDKAKPVLEEIHKARQFDSNSIISLDIAGEVHSSKGTIFKYPNGEAIKDPNFYRWGHFLETTANLNNKIKKALEVLDD